MKQREKEMGRDTVASLQLTSVNLRRHQSVTDAPSFLSTRRLLSRTINTVRACSTSGSADTGPAWHKEHFSTHKLRCCVQPQPAFFKMPSFQKEHLLLDSVLRHLYRAAFTFAQTGIKFSQFQWLHEAPAFCNLVDFHLKCHFCCCYLNRCRIKWTL